MRCALRVGAFVVTASLLAMPGFAQQRPLQTEDPETIGSGRMLIEGGIDLVRGQHYPLSGLEGNLLRMPTIGISLGVSSIAEVQIDGGLYQRLNITGRNPAPLSSELQIDGDSTYSIEDATVGLKTRLLAETARRPAIALRFATKLPNASNESGLGLDTIDFFQSLLVAKTVQSVRVVGNVGLGILSDPTNGHRQNDVLTYGVSLARAVTQQSEVVGEINGRASTRSGGAFPGTESRGLLTLGGRYTKSTIRLDAGVYFGLTTFDPTIGLTVGFTYVFNALTIP